MDTTHQDAIPTPRSARWLRLAQSYGDMAQQYKARERYADYVVCSLHAANALERMRVEIGREARR